MTIKNNNKENVELYMYDNYIQVSYFCVEAFVLYTWRKYLKRVLYKKVERKFEAFLGLF